MFKISNFLENDDVEIIARRGPFRVIQWKRDLSVTGPSAQEAWFASQMNVRRRQVVADLSEGSVIVQAGAMQWTVGDVEANTGVKGVGDFFGKSLRGAVTKESAIKPEYRGTGLLVLEPTYRHIVLTDVDHWGGAIVLDDGVFLASQSSLSHKTVARSSFSSAVAGGEGPARGAHRDRAQGRRAQDRRQYGHGVERVAALHRRAVGQVAHRLCRLGRGTRERLPRDRARPHVADGLHLCLRPGGHEPLGACEAAWPRVCLRRLLRAPLESMEWDAGGPVVMAPPASCRRRGVRPAPMP